MNQTILRWKRPLLLIVLTFLSTSYVGALMEEPDSFNGWNFSSWNFFAGAPFSLPLMTILLAHEFGHYLAAKRHGVATSPPYFIPLPLPPFGTMGALIAMRDRIKSRNALLDIGASGPIAGLVIAIPVLVYGIIESPVNMQLPDGSYIMEGRSLLYVSLLYLLKGPIPEGYDIMLSSTALAGWAGLLVTMINLIPIGQLDGGHIAYALFGKKQLIISKRLRSLMPLCALLIGLMFALNALLDGKPFEAAKWEIFAGLHWFIWWIVLTLMVRLSGLEHPDTDEGPLSKKRRFVAIGTLIIFALLFMPSWMREVYL